MSNKITIRDATLYLGDCAEVLPTITAEAALVTDPPYKFNASGGGHMRRKRYGSNELLAKGLHLGFDMGIIDGLRFPTAVVFCHNDQLQEMLQHMNGHYHRVTTCAWHKTNPPPYFNKHLLPDTEFYIHGWNRGWHPQSNIKDRNRYIISKIIKSELPHPTVKPLEVMDKVLRNVTGDTIIDPFMGTGTTGLAAIAQGRKFIGIEKDPAYFQIAIDRFENAIRQEAA